MEEADRARTAARDAVRDVEPSDLQRAMVERLSDCSAVPGALVFFAADATSGHTDDGLAERAAGVLLVYEGLALTRELVAAVPWTADGDDADTPADLDVLAADVLVAKGFRLLARTEAADAAVRTVREFGRERTDIQAGRESSTRSLEASVFDLAVVAGASASTTDVPLSLRQYAVGLADSWGERPLGAPEDVLPEHPAEVMARVAGPSAPDGDDAVRPSATDH